MEDPIFDPASEQAQITHCFYVSVTPAGYKLEMFDMDSPENDKVIITHSPMDIIRSLTNGNNFYYEYDLLPHAAHCMKAYYNEAGELVTKRDELLYCLPGSDMLTEKMETLAEYWKVYPHG